LVSIAADKKGKATNAKDKANNEMLIDTSSKNPKEPVYATDNTPDIVKYEFMEIT
jgi:hypothetical protein